MNERDQLRQEIASLVDTLAKDPLNVTRYQRLWEAAVRYKAAGGKDVSLLQRLARSSSDPIRKLQQNLKLWCFDSSDSQRLLEVARAIEAVAMKSPEADVKPLADWLAKLAKAMREH